MRGGRDAPPDGREIAAASHSREALPPPEGSLPSEEECPFKGGTVMTGKAREHEVRVMGIGLAALALLAAVAALWVASAVGDHLRAPSLGGAQVSQSSG